MTCSSLGNKKLFPPDKLKVLHELKSEIEKSLSADYLINNRVEKHQATVDKIIDKKNIQIETLKEVLELLEK